VIIIAIIVHANRKGTNGVNLVNIWLVGYLVTVR